MSTPDLEAHRPVLHRYALLHVRDAVAAEDLVQATFVAALQAADSFRGESSLQTWLVGILKRKVIDHHRARIREEPLPGAGSDDDGTLLDRFFQEDGHWSAPPRTWPTPDEALENEAFWRVFEQCAEHLPGATGRVFLLREVVGLEPDEVCKDLSLTKSNYWVLMHRARVRLRECLGKNWFGESS